MRIKLKLFAFFRQAFGASDLQYEIRTGATAQDLLDDIMSKHPTLEKSRNHVVITINKHAVHLDAPLHEGDEVAILPPVSGG
jgi:molybdopterin synthase sulfur carrier subunit